MARSSILVTDYKKEGPDIMTGLNVARTSLQISFENERQMVASGLARLGKPAAKIAHKITNTTTWNEFHCMVVEAVQPPLRPVATMKKLVELKYNEDRDDTLLALHKLVDEAYPWATPQERENYIFSELICILPDAIADHFAIHDPKGLDQDITIRRLLTTIKPAIPINHVTPPRCPDQQHRHSQPPRLIPHRRGKATAVTP